MIKNKILKIAKVKLFILVIFISQILSLGTVHASVSAQEIHRYINISTTNIVPVISKNVVKNEPQPLTPAEIEELNRENLLKARAVSIDSFLISKESPLAGFGYKLIELEDKYGVPAKLVVAISGIESSFCQINFKPYNCWGWFGGNGFTSYNDALERYVYYLKSFYFDRGLTTPATIGPVYCVPPQNWINKVTAFMNTTNI